MPNLNNKINLLLFYIFCFILAIFLFVEYGLKTVYYWFVGFPPLSLGESIFWFNSVISFVLDPFLITRFFDVLLIPVFPLILAGIWLGHSKMNRLGFAKIPIGVVNFLSCFTPITFIFACAYSSFYILLFLQSSLKNDVLSKLTNLSNSAIDIYHTYGFDYILLSLKDCSHFVGDHRIPFFSEETLHQFVIWLAKCTNSDGLKNDVILKYPSASWGGEAKITGITEIAQKNTEYLYSAIINELADASAAYFVYLPELEIEWKFLFDELTVAMFLVVSVVTSLVILFAWVYISHDERRPIFFFLLTIFAGFIIVLVAAQNYFVLFIGWEGVGLSSFLLINFWYTRLQANKAASKAVIVNRVGDVFLIAALGVMYYNTNTLDFTLATDRLLNNPYYNYTAVVETICLFFFFAAVGKSAQLGLHTWLPDAIEGPTPVSALLHAATMVTAGIYLLIRSSSLVSYCTVTPFLISVLGLLTAFFAATAALLQYDMKKVVAYSTCSQLGYIIMSVGLKQYNISFFHLFNHAFFKALLFIAAGSIIHSLINEQDIRKMGGLANTSFFLFLSNSIGVAALAGSLFLSGFYSKDLILETSISTFTISGLVIYWLATLTAIFTGIYSSDVLDDSFIEETNSRKKTIEGVHAITWIETAVLFILALFSLFSGYVFKDIFVGLGSPFLNTHYSITGDLYMNLNILGAENRSSNYVLSSEFLPVSVKLLPVIASFAIGFQWRHSESTVYRIHSAVSFMSNKWYFDMLQNRYLVYSFFKIGYSVFWVWDKYLFEQFRMMKFYHKK